MALRTTAQSREAGRAPLPLSSRRDTWWLRPLLTVIVLGSFVVYATWRGLENQFYEVGPYLSPFYSPLLPINLSIGGWNISPAIYIIAFPLLFRLTCYYYRLAYYRAFFWDPPACAIQELAARKHYTGDNFDEHEESYRRGYTAALHPQRRGRAYSDVEDELRTQYANTTLDMPFQSGYERGLNHRSRGVE